MKQLRLPTGLMLATVLAVSAIAYAQETRPAVVAFGAASPERGTARVGYWNTQKNTGAGGFFIDYGRPQWRSEYEDRAKFDAMTKGKTWRMGSDYWTVLDTNIPLIVSGTKVPAGIWYLGLHRSDDGAKWSLAFVDPAKVRETRLDPSQIDGAPVAFRAPMNVESSAEVTEKLTITLTVPKEKLNESTMTLSWGKMRLSARIAASLQ